MRCSGARASFGGAGASKRRGDSKADGRFFHWQAQSQPHAPFGTPPHVIPGGQVPHLQKLHVRPLSLGSPQGIVSPVHPHVVPPIAVQVMPCGQSGWVKGSQLGMPPGPQSAAPQYAAVAGGQDVVVAVIVVVVVGGATGAQSNFGAVGVTERLPN